jgi:hypothetical protein
MEALDTNQLLELIKEKEKRSTIRGLLIVFIPCIAAIILIAFTSNKVLKAQGQLQAIDSIINENKVDLSNVQSKLKTADSLNKDLAKKNDSLSKILIESAQNLGQAISVTTEFRSFIDKMQPYLRSQQEASFYINFRMTEDKIRGNYENLSSKIAGLPDLDSNLVWIVIVQSSMSLTDLQKDVGKLQSIYGADQVAIYKDSRNNFALSIIGNGTFTRAYRLNVELRDKYGYNGAYFSSAQKWGTNYLK